MWVSETARDALLAAAGSAQPHETGGVLVGVVLGQGEGAGRPWVTHAVEVPSRKRGRNHYELPAGARHRVVTRLRTTDPRLGYLGDWHSHPADMGPSPRDLESIESISVKGDCSRPLLFLVRRGRQRYRLDPHQWTGRSLRHLQVRVAGSLPQQDSTVGRKRQRSIRLPRRAKVLRGNK